MFAKRFILKDNQVHINIFKKVGSHSVTELQNALFFSLSLSERGIYEGV